MTPEERELCLDIMNEHFGELVKSVCVKLLKYPNITLGDLTKRCSSSSAVEIKQCLSVLLQHNVLNISVGEPKSSKKGRVSIPMLYKIDVHRTIRRLCFPHYIHQSKEIFGPIGERIMERLVLHGRFRLDQHLIDLCSELSVEETEIQQVFYEMTKRRFISRVHPIRLPTTTSSTSDSNGRKRQRIEQEEEKSMDATPLEVEMMMKGKKKRAQLPQRGQDVPTDLVWQVGVDQFDIESRHAACVAYASEKMNPLAGKIIETILIQSRVHEKDFLEPSSRPLTGKEIFASELVQTALPPGCLDGWTLILNYLRVMSHERTGMVIQVASDHNSDGGQFSVHLQKIMTALRSRTIQSTISAKFGTGSSRIIMILLEQQQLEQKRIGELAMLPSTQVRRRLYELFKDQWIQMQEIPKRNDYNPLQTFYCWTTTQDVLKNRIRNRLVGASLRVRQRRALEMDAGQDLIARSDSLVETKDLEQFDKLSRSLDRLDQSILRLHDMWRVFQW